MERETMHAFWTRLLTVMVLATALPVSARCVSEGLDDVVASTPAYCDGCRAPDCDQEVRTWDCCTASPQAFLQAGSLAVQKSSRDSNQPPKPAAAPSYNTLQLSLAKLGDAAPSYPLTHPIGAGVETYLITGRLRL